MIKDLGKEEEEDLKKKDECEANRAKDTREAVKIARAMDDTTDSITSDESKIKEIDEEIKEKKTEIESIYAELKEAKTLREKEEAEYKVAKADDKEALAVVDQAKKVLQDFYKEKGMAFAQQKKRAQAPFESEAGKAPPPPPSTWEGDYGGKTQESGNIITMLDMIFQDIEKDIYKAKEEEEAAEKRYGETQKALQAEVKDLNKAIDDLVEAQGDKVKAVEGNTEDRRIQKGDLATLLKRIADAEPGCDFLVINYPLRVKNRQTEIDGLEKAKAILSKGASSLIAVEGDSHKLKTGEAALVQGRLRASRKQSHMALE